MGTMGWDMERLFLRKKEEFVSVVEDSKTISGVIFSYILRQCSQDLRLSWLVKAKE